MKTQKSEVVAYAVRGSGKLSVNGHYVDIPAGWEVVPSGDAALTRRLKATASDYWVVKRKFGRKEFGVGLCVPAGIAATIARDLSFERETPEYQRKLDAGRQRRAKEQQEYQVDFEDAVLDFLAFHPRWRELAARLAKTVTEFTTPVGSGTVARTRRIPIEERARAAVIAWMRHNTTDYDKRYIPHVAGKRREVRRDIAHGSIDLLNAYRRGLDAPENCPLQAALERLAHKTPPAPTAPDGPSHRAPTAPTAPDAPTAPTAPAAPPAARLTAPKRPRPTKPHLNKKISDGDFFA